MIQKKPPEFTGFNTRKLCEQNHTVQPGTTVAYMPLVDMVPSDPSTVMTVKEEAQQFTRQTGQTITVFTADQQL